MTRKCWVPNLKGCLAIGMLFSSLSLTLRADQVEMRNGDRYLGSVSSMDGDTVTLRSETLGTIRLPRAKVMSVTLGSDSSAKSLSLSTNRAVGSLVAGQTNKATESLTLAKQLAANTNAIQQIQSQLLAGAGPEANAKFNEMLNGMLSGKLTVADIRAQARTAASQIRAAKKELGEEETGLALDSYLAILDQFLNETGPVTQATDKQTVNSKKQSSPPEPE